MDNGTSVCVSEDFESEARLDIVFDIFGLTEDDCKYMSTWILSE